MSWVPRPTVPGRTPAFTPLIVQAQRLHEADRLPEADVVYRQVLQYEPRSFGALHGRGLIALRLNRLEEGAKLIGAALDADPSQPDAWLNLSRAQLQLGRPADALRAADAALRLRPVEGAAHLARAAALMSGRPPVEAIELLSEVVRLAPDHADAWNELGDAQRGLNLLDEALESFQRALQIDANHRGALAGFAQVLQSRNRYEDAALVYERLWQQHPDAAFALGRMLFCKAMICDWLHFEPLCRRIETEVAAGRPVVEPFGIQGWCTSPAILYRAAQTYTATLYPDRGLPRPALRPDDGRLRIGYVSGEFRHQATSILMVELLERHDRSRFEVIGFDNGDDDRSDLRYRIEAAFDRLLPIAALDDAAAAALVREQGVDVLVNLNGFFGNTRTGVFQLRPAPVQVNYLGFPGTMAAPYMDYLIADRWVIPGDGHAHYSEAIVTLPDCYQPNDTRRRISDEVLTRRDLALPDEAFVFCCFNNTYKLTPQVFSVWARLLRQVPGSVLWLFGWVPEAALNLAGHCRDHGIDPSRVVAAPFWPQEKHLARLRLADLFLDTFPYNAHTTGSDALWAGLPVLTCMGDTFPSRVGASLLAAAGLPELITHSLAEYEALALRLALEPALLASLRQRLASNRARAPLFDMPCLARHIESAYEAIVARARAGQPPAPLQIGLPATTG